MAVSIFALKTGFKKRILFVFGACLLKVEKNLMVTIILRYMKDFSSFGDFLNHLLSAGRTHCSFWAEVYYHRSKFFNNLKCFVNGLLYIKQHASLSVCTAIWMTWPILLFTFWPQSNVSFNLLTCEIFNAWNFLHAKPNIKGVKCPGGMYVMVVVSVFVIWEAISS